MRDERERGMRIFVRLGQEREGEQGPVRLLHSGTALMLDLVLAGNARIGLPYAHLVRVSWCSGERVTLEYSENVVEIEGRDLLGLYAGICAHRVFRVTVRRVGDLSPTSSGPVIERISILTEGMKSHLRED